VSNFSGASIAILAGDCASASRRFIRRLVAALFSRILFPESGAFLNFELERFLCRRLGRLSKIFTK
jgi:hypothetical protein